VLPAIKLDDQLCFRTKEVGNITGNRNLPSELETCQLLQAQALP
jgi:hypothetical protein